MLKNLPLVLIDEKRFLLIALEEYVGTKAALL